MIVDLEKLIKIVAFLVLTSMTACVFVPSEGTVTSTIRSPVNAASQLLSEEDDSPQYETRFEYELQNTDGANVCVASCNSNQNTCQSQCNKREEACVLNAMRHAKRRYEAYLKKIAGQNTKATLTENDFYDERACVNTCNCVEEYNSCYRLCGGKVNKVTYCVNNCE